jgi:hypothetical protein
MLRFLFRALSALVVLAGLSWLAAPVAAHDEIISGNYAFTIGWLIEPVVVGQPNSLDLFIAPNEEHTEGESDHDHPEGVEGAEATLEFTVEYGTVRRSYDLLPVANEPGRYTASFIPTREGQYTFNFTGTINGEAVDVRFEPEEVSSPGPLAFPEAVPSITALSDRVIDLQSRLSLTQVLAGLSLALAVVATGLSVYILRKK